MENKNSLHSQLDTARARVLALEWVFINCLITETQPLPNRHPVSRHPVTTSSFMGANQ